MRDGYENISVCVHVKVLNSQKYILKENTFVREEELMDKIYEPVMN